MFVVADERDRIVLRNYVPDNNTWNPLRTEQILSDEQKAKILDDANQVIYSVEYIYEDCMPNEMKMLVNKNLSETELIIKAMEMRNRISAILAEIIITPVCQKIDGFPKTYSANDNLVRILENFNQVKDTTPDGRDWVQLN